jgi:hypothetical protein
MRDYDTWKTTPPEPETVGSCAECRNEIYAGEEILVTVNDEKIHTDCWDDFRRAKMPKKKIMLECKVCDSVIQDDEICVTEDGEAVHNDCWDDYARDEMEVRTEYAGGKY